MDTQDANHEEDPTAELPLLGSIIQLDDSGQGNPNSSFLGQYGGTTRQLGYLPQSLRSKSHTACSRGVLQ